jgi:hypothetical protein
MCRRLPPRACPYFPTTVRLRRACTGCQPPPPLAQVRVLQAPSFSSTWLRHTWAPIPSLFLSPLWFKPPRAPSAALDPAMPFFHLAARACRRERRIWSCPHRRLPLSVSTTTGHFHLRFLCAFTVPLPSWSCRILSTSPLATAAGMLPPVHYPHPSLVTHQTGGSPPPYPCPASPHCTTGDPPVVSSPPRSPMGGRWACHCAVTRASTPWWPCGARRSAEATIP